MLRSWRTLPGQACTCSVAMASSAKARARQARGGAEALDEVVDQLGNVLAPLGQPRHAHRHHVQAVEQVLAEAAGGDLLAQVARGRGDHPHVHLHVGVAADPAEALVDQDAQDPALALPRHVGHFVEVERAAVGALEDADLARPAALAFLAEQLQVHAAPASCRRR